VSLCHSTSSDQPSVTYASIMPRVTFRNARGLRLVADYVAPGAAGAAPGRGAEARGDGAAARPSRRLADAPLVVLAHGFGSHRRARDRFPTMAQAFAAAGYATLAFDFAGSGESDDDVLTLEHEVEDLLAAIAYGRGLGHERLGLVGHSLGGRVCLQASPAGVTTIATAGAPTGPVDYDWRDYFSAEQMDELTRTGRVTMPQDGPPRAAVVADVSLLEELMGCDQRALFARVTCPVLLIDGDGDSEELDYLALARRGLPLLPAGSRIEVVAGCPHNLVGHLDRVIALLLAWLREHLPADA
jgi:putative redox protein